MTSPTTNSHKRFLAAGYAAGAAAAQLREALYRAIEEAGLEAPGDAGTGPTEEQVILLFEGAVTGLLNEWRTKQKLSQTNARPQG